jgi:hypothetical protein
LNLFGRLDHHLRARIEYRCDFVRKPTVEKYRRPRGLAFCVAKAGSQLPETLPSAQGCKEVTPPVAAIAEEDKDATARRTRQETSGHVSLAKCFPEIIESL